MTLSVYPIIDMETTGLVAHKEHLLEVAALVVDSDLNILDEVGFQVAVYYDQDTADDLANNARTIVRDMHEESGLWEDLPDGMPLAEVDQSLRDYLARFEGTAGAPIVGNSVRLDANFRDEHLPLTAELMGFRLIDVSSLARVAHDWWGLPYYEKKRAHRAMDDVRETLAELRYLKANLLNPMLLDGGL